MPTPLTQPEDDDRTKPDDDAVEAGANEAGRVLRKAASSGLLAAASVAWRARPTLVFWARWRLHGWLGELNNLLLPPLFTIILIDLGQGGLPTAMSGDVASANYVFGAMFLAEWMLGLSLARDKGAYARNLWLLGDFISALPLANLFQAARLARVGRLLRFVKLLKLVRARRFSFPLGRFARAIGVTMAVALSGAVALEALEPDTVAGFGEALWWSIVTVSTVGYGDIAPTTDLGRIIAAVLMVTGVGTFSYLAGLMGAVVFDPEEEEVLSTVIRLEGQLEEVLRRLDAGEDPRPDRAP